MRDDKNGGVSLTPAETKRALRIVTELMAIPGRSGQEGEVASVVREHLVHAGVAAAAITFDTAHRQSAIGGEVGNLIVKLPGTAKVPRRLLMAHLDTVPLCVGSRPVQKANRIVPSGATGLGGDNRAGVTVVLCTALSILERGLPHPPLTLFFPVQEEIGLVGARFANVNELGSPALCFNWDGGDPKRVIYGATGADSLEIRVTGIASHAGVHPEHGVSAIGVAAYAIADLQNNGWLGLINKESMSGTSNVGIVQGGEATNVVMPEVVLNAEVRSHDAGFREKVILEIRKAFERASERLRNTQGQTGSVEITSELRYESFRLDTDSRIVTTAADAIRRVGLEPEFVVGNGGLDANWMSAHGLPTVTLGCGQHDIHTVKEFLDVEEFQTACQIAMGLATADAASG